MLQVLIRAMERPLRYLSSVHAPCSEMSLNMIQNRKIKMQTELNSYNFEHICIKISDTNLTYLIPLKVH